MYYWACAARRSAPKTPEQVEELYTLARVLEREESGLDLTPGERSLVSRLLAELDLENLSGLRHHAPPRALSDLVPQLEFRAAAADRERTASSSYWAEFVQQQEEVGSLEKRSIQYWNT